jgi:urea carboxylase
LRDYQQFLRSHASSIAAFKTRQQAAFDAERERWRAMGRESDNAPELTAESNGNAGRVDAIPEGCIAVSSPVTGSVWQLKARVGERAAAGSALIVIESMKMEINVQSEQSGTVVELRCQRGQPVMAGDTLLVLRPGA